MKSERKNEISSELQAEFDKRLKELEDEFKKSVERGKTRLRQILYDIQSYRDSGDEMEANESKVSEDFLIYLFQKGAICEGKIKIDWNTSVDYSDRNNLLSSARQNSAFRLFEHILGSMQQRGIKIPSSFKLDTPLPILEIYKKYGVAIDIDAQFEKGENPWTAWPYNNLTKLQDCAMQGNVNDVLVLLDSFHANPNTRSKMMGVTTSYHAPETALTKMIVNILRKVDSDARDNPELDVNEILSADFIQNQLNIVKSLAAYGLEFSQNDRDYIRNAKGSKTDCDVFLMSPPNDGKYKNTNLNELYLYKDNEDRFFYHLDNKPFFLEYKNAPLKENQLRQEIKDPKMLEALNKNLIFDQESNNPEECKSSVVSQLFLRFTAKKHHTNEGREYPFPRSFHRLAEKHREQVLNIFERMINAYNEGRKMYVERLQKDATLVVPNFVDVSELFSGGFSQLSDVVSEYVGKDSNRDEAFATGEYYKDKGQKAEKKDNVDNIQRPFILSGKGPNLSETHRLFAGGHNPLTNIIKDYDQDLKQQLEESFKNKGESKSDAPQNASEQKDKPRAP